MSVDASQVKELRERTGAGMMEAKKAIEESGGDIDSAIEILRKKGMLKAEKKSQRATGAGIIDTYIHGDGRIGVMLEVNCETDFVARNNEFRKLVHDLALHIAAQAPLYVDRDEVPKKIAAKEKEIYAEAAAGEGKPGNIVEKIAAGKLEKFYEEICLMEQPFVKNPDITVEELIGQAIAKLGENIRVRRFIRYVLGE